MRKHRQGIIAAFVAVIMLATCLSAVGFAAETTDLYATYNLYVTDYVYDADDNVVVELDLYVNYARTANVLNSGRFGLRFPDTFTVEFAPDTANVELFPLYPTSNGAAETLEMKAPGQHYFQWSVSPNATNPPELAFKPREEAKELSVFGENVLTQQVPGGVAMRIGTYSITLDNGFPARNAIGMLDWLTTDLSQDAMYSTVTEGKSINGEIWNDSDGDGVAWYQGHYADKTTLEVVHADVPFVFTPPDYWQNSFTVRSYDPKKQINLTLFDEYGTIEVANGFSVPTYAAEDTGYVYAATDLNKNTGVGAYYTAIDLDTYTLADGQELVAGEKYLLEIRKEGHLVQKLMLEFPDSGFLSEAVGLPENSAPLHLPAGDINPVGAGDAPPTFGDGRIDMADRTLVLCLIGQAAANSAAQPSYYADIDGDRRISLKDLSILLSPENYGKHVKEGY